MVRVFTDIRDSKLTRTAKYMFFIELSIYHLMEVENAIECLQPRLGETFDKINVYLHDENSSDYSIYEQENNDVKTYVYHILVDTRNPRFNESLIALKKNHYYVDCYQYKSSDSNKAIIRMKVICKDRIPLLLKSQYSKMYKASECEAWFRNKSLIQRYQVWDVATSTNKTHSSMHTLMHTKEALDDLVERLGIKEQDLIETISKNEFDSKFELSKESISFDKLN